MELQLTLITWCFVSIMILGVGYRILTLIFGEIADAAGGMLESVEGLFEGVGIDVLPEAAEGTGAGGLSCGLIAAFLTGFGVVGTMSALLGATTGGSLLLAVLSGLVFGGVYFALAALLVRQQASSALRRSDLIGAVARVTTRTPGGEVGEAFLELRSQRKRYPIREVEAEELVRGDLVEVVRQEGGTLFVRKRT